MFKVTYRFEGIRDPAIERLANIVLIEPDCNRNFDIATLADPG